MLSTCIAIASGDMLLIVFPNVAANLRATANGSAHNAHRLAASTALPTKYSNS